jgi:hypothetical protein
LAYPDGLRGSKDPSDRTPASVPARNEQTRKGTLAKWKLPTPEDIALYLSIPTQPKKKVGLKKENRGPLEKESMTREPLKKEGP